MSVVLPESRIRHIFRNAAGHLRDTAGNRQALIELVNNPHNHAGTDRLGHAWYVALQEDGSQLWAIVRRNEILNGGRNEAPREFDPRSGLSNPEKKR